MHVLIVSFHLRGISPEEYEAHSESIAPAFSQLPGLVSKTWLASRETNTYGGVYLWRDRRAMERYKETDIFKGMLSNPHLGGVSVSDYAVLEGPTRTTQVQGVTRETRPRLQPAPGGVAFVA
jgi:hypothetical protein